MTIFTIFSVFRKYEAVTMVLMARRIVSLVLVSALSLAPTLSSPHRQNSKRMSIWDAVPDKSFRSGEIHEGSITQTSNPVSIISGKSIQQTRSGRQIQPLSCVSKGGDEAGVCMFAWNCVEAGGKHLGTCIDRSVS